MNPTQALYRAVLLDQEGLKEYSVHHDCPQISGESGRWLGPLSAVNVFVGPNNTGKSRLLRHLFSRGPATTSGLLGTPALQKYVDIFVSHMSPFRDPLLHFVNRNSLDRDESAAAAMKSIALALAGDFHHAAKLWSGTQPRIIEDLKACKRGIEARAASNAERFSPYESILTELTKSIMNTIRALHIEGKNVAVEQPDPLRVYVPMLRGLRTHGSEDVYWQRTVQDYFPAFKGETAATVATKRCEIVTGLSLYKQVERLQRGTFKERNSIQEYCKFLGRSFFDGASVEIVPRAEGDRSAGNDLLYIKVGNEMEFPVSHLGDGISHIIILTFSMVLNKDKPVFLFLEEPETCLHPGYQRLLVQALLREPCLDNARRQVFITTHSHQFLDLTLDCDDISVFSFSKILPQGDLQEKTASFRVIPRAHGSLHTLRELGVHNSSVFLSNCTIWVEGITDRLYLRRWLELFQEHLKQQGDAAARIFHEDLHFSFVEYGGSNITHWSFLDDDGIRVERLCGQLCLIADRDSTDANPQSAKAVRLSRLKEDLKERFYLLPRTEIENMHSAEVLLKVMAHWEGSEKVLSFDIEYEDYRSVRMGSYVEEVLSKNGCVSVRKARDNHPYAAENGALKSKLSFAELAIGFTNRWDDLSDDAKHLTEWLYKFVASNNPRF